MNVSSIPKKFLKNPIHFLALGFGSGLAPIMPGTIGTLVAVPLYMLMHYLPLKYYLIVVAIMLVVGFWITDKTANDLQIKDPGCVVWDEIVGYLITMILVPFNWQMMALGFIFFRIFDIWKPWPISWVNDNMRSGIGIMLDDVVAAVYAIILLHFVIIVCPMTCI